MRALVSISLALFALACTSTPDQDDPEPATDAGSTGTDGGGESPTDAGTSTDAGPDLPACNDGDELPCTGNTAGTCRPGTRYCDQGKFGRCEGRLQPAPGACDVDNCEGGLNTGCACKVGATRECFTGEEDTLGKGPCRRGFEECVPSAGGSQWGGCRNEVKAQPVDDCSGRDLDCDLGPPASGCSCTNGQTRPCGGVAGGTCQLGTQTCAGGTWGACTGAVQPEPGNCDTTSCLGGPNPGCHCRIGETAACYTSIFGTEGTGTCAAGTRTCNSPGVWGPCFGQKSPSPPCDRHPEGLTCTGAFAPGCE